jgi:putative salt-induced outer membrane protein
MMRALSRSLSLVALAASVVVAQDPPKKPPYEFVGDFALAASQGNQKVTTVSLGQRYSYDFGGWKFSQTAAALRGTANGVRNAELYQGGLRGDFKITPKLSAYTSLNGLRNTPAGLNRQSAEAIGLAYQFTDTDTDKLKVSAGLGLLQRQFVGGGDSQNDKVGNVDGLYRHLFSKVSFFEQTATWTPNFSRSDAWLFTSQSSLVAPLSSRFGLKVGYLINYNNLPPFTVTSAGLPTTTRFKKFDGLLTTGVQFTY